jgi:hypothetical protein
MGHPVHDQYKLLIGSQRAYFKNVLQKDFYDKKEESTWITRATDKRSADNPIREKHSKSWFYFAHQTARLWNTLTDFLKFPITQKYTFKINRNSELFCN